MTRKSYPKKKTPAKKRAPAKSTTLGELLAEKMGATTQAETPVIPPQPESAWMNGEVSQEASTLTLAAALLEDFDSDTPFIQVRAMDVLCRALRQAADDCELAGAAQDGLDHAATVRRVLTRIETRSRIAIEIARRMVVEARS